jgi:hypothetical protein
MVAAASGFVVSIDRRGATFHSMRGPVKPAAADPGEKLEGNSAGLIDHVLRL